MENSTFSTVEETTETSNTTSENIVDDLAYYRKLAVDMRLYIIPLLAIPGLLGNLASFLIMTSQQMRKRSTSVYLSLLAVADSMVILHYIFTQWLHAVLRDPFIWRSDLLCKLEEVHRRFSALLGAWAVVMVTFERFLITWFPIKSKRWCSVRNARISIAMLVVLVLADALGESLQFGIRSGPCDLERMITYQQQSNLRWITPLLYSFIPIGVLITLNTATAIKLRLQAGQALTDISANQRRKMAARATKVVLIVSTSYLVLTVPVTIYLPLSQAIRAQTLETPAMLLIDEMCFLILLINHSINFYLYIMSGETFRNEASTMFKRWLRIDSNQNQNAAEVEIELEP